MILQAGTSLFRYCLGDNMPSEWTIQYHSPEYHSSIYGEKNQIGAFFFYRDETTARNVLSAAVEKSVQQGRCYDRNTITSCDTTADINLLDLTRCDRPVQILNILYDNGIDVLSTDFSKYLDDIIPFNTIRGYHKYIMDNEGNEDWIIKSDMNEYGNKIDQFFQWRVGYIGQLMTDFKNGFAFKEQLLTKGYEGYLFMEEKSSPTICIFDSSKLSAPIHTIVHTISE